MDFHSLFTEGISTVRKALMRTEKTWRTQGLILCVERLGFNCQDIVEEVLGLRV